MTSALFSTVEDRHRGARALTRMLMLGDDDRDLTLEYLRILIDEGLPPAGGHDTQSWARDFYAFGEASVFAPGQFTLLHPAIPLPEGPLHFAGEHTSLKHAWIEGAIESAVRTTIEVHERQGLT